MGSTPYSRQQSVPLMLRSGTHRSGIFFSFFGGAGMTPKVRGCLHFFAYLVYFLALECFEHFFFGERLDSSDAFEFEFEIIASYCEEELLKVYTCINIIQSL